MKTEDFASLKLEIQQKAKYGIDFIFSASIIWMLISIIWSLEKTPTGKSVLTFIIGAFLLPLALLISKLIQTTWKIKDNPLAPLGLWLNFSQLIYFPFLFFFFYKEPIYFIMAYSIITGAHLFPFAWFYDQISYAIIAVIISLGAFIISFVVEPHQFYFIPIFTSIGFFFLGIWLVITLISQKKEKIIAPY